MLTRLILPGVTRVWLRLPGEDEPATIAASTARALFALGVGLGPRHAVPRSKRDLPEVTVDGPARFFVSGVEVGEKRGLRTIRVGLGHVLDLLSEVGALNEVRRRAYPVPGSTGRASHLAGGVAGDVPAEEFVDVATAQQRFDDMIAAIGQGRRAVLVQDGTPVAVMLPWSLWRDMNAELAWAQYVRWATWGEDGVFDAETHVALLRGGPPSTEDLRAHKLGRERHE
ncbi:hypothetical protein CTKZ_08530 [Cellulomonas algicola]|uniref:Uncharacterized protein n=1 Tax=Cellulomonas algicola TaxID=2071633 RepID=A0A401UX86_9CELL|nr:hypothetical protein [Cellulomonas algicola]GCD19291.1 hypothetical protein CTKZ_08530 [Cellulomonas algicola]